MNLIVAIKRIKGRSVKPPPSDGVLKNVRRKDNELLVIVEHGGDVRTARIASQLSFDFLILLRHILLQHWGESLSTVQNIEVDFGGLA